MSASPSQRDDASSTDPTTAKGTRPHPPSSVSGQQQPSHRGLPPITTTATTTTRPGRPKNASASGSPPRTAFSPAAPSVNPAAIAANRQVASRQSSTSSTHSLASPSGPPYTAGQLHAAQRSRTIAGGSPRLAPTVGGLTPQTGGNSSRLARHSPSLSISSTVGSPISSGTSSAGGTGQLTSLIITQLNILLSTIKELAPNKDKAKWEAQADKVWGLVESNGMEVTLHYFRRLLQSNATSIFAGSKPPGDANGNHHLLVTEMQKILQDPSQVDKIAQSLDTNESDLFRDFDLASFMEHFQLDPIAKVALALAARTATKPDLRFKADNILTSNFPTFLQTLVHPHQDDVSPAVIASIIDRLLQDPPKGWSEEQRTDLTYAIRVRYNRLSIRIPPAVESVMFLIELMESQDSRVLKLIQRAGFQSTASVDLCKETLASAESRDISYVQTANALLFTAIAHNGDAYDAKVLVAALRQHRAGKMLDWTDVVSSFDREGLRVTKKQFLILYNALIPVAKENASFDIQSLWGGAWHHQETQLSFVVAFLSTTPNELDVTQIPNLRQAFTLEDFDDASDSVKAFADEAIKHPLVSRDATEALFTMIFRSQETYHHAQLLGIPGTLINPNMPIFVCAASGVAKPWGALQEQALKQLFYPFLLKRHENYDFVMHLLWRHDKTWVAGRMVEFYQTDQMLLEVIFEHAQENGWLNLLLTISSSFAVDLATYAHGKGECNLEEWSQQHVATMGLVSFARAIVDFIRGKMDDESAVQREKTAKSTMPLTVRTVHALISMISEALPEEDATPLQRQMLGLYPRLINYGEDPQRDAIIETNGQTGNSLPEDASAAMEEQYKRMYGGGIDANDLVPELKRLKVSDNPADQDVFACMIHGLFDEYNCFGEYPNEALATTAVLFGGIIASNVLSGISMQVALFMIFEAVSEYGPDDPMWRFGLQALVQLQTFQRLKDWPNLCERILRISSLRGTDVERTAAEVLREVQQDSAGLNGDVGPNGLTNGSLDSEFPVDSPTPPFSAVRIDPPLRPELYETPNEEVSDKVMFVLNNVSKRNLEEKFKELQGTLEDRHHQWFAHYLVEELAKSQPNFQGLYLQILENFNRKILWLEVLRETYVACARMLNAQSTMDSAPERTSLKNLASWLGSLTLARDQPILHRNISFKDLLLEAHDTQRFLVAIPFTCKVLLQATHSKVFKPPNPWLMELLGYLAELYKFMDLKLNFKFEIEVLCKELNLDINKIEPAELIRARPILPDNSLTLQTYVPDGADSFGDIAIMGLSKRSPNERFSPQTVIQNLPELSGRLHIPQAAGNITQGQLTEIFVNAAQAAIQEIIAPVVERSVTIAAISTAELVQKDFATEADVEKLTNSAHTVVKALSGSLALVTCKEPLRMSIMNNIRILASRNVPEQLPEGQILMFVNDNIDTVCNLVEQAAEEHSLAEIDAQLRQALEQRNRHNEERPNEPFAQQPVNRWAQMIPEPYRQEIGGLNWQQLSLYEDFGRQARIQPTGHIAGASQDTTRQLPDVLADSYIPSLPTPAGEPAMPRPTPQQQRMQTMAPASNQQVNVYMDPPNIGQRILGLMQDLQQAAQEAQEEHIAEIEDGAPIRKIFEELVALISQSSQKDSLAIAAGHQSLSMVFTDSQKKLEVEVLVRLVTQLCRVSNAAGRAVTMTITTIEDDKFFNAPVVITMVREGLYDLQYIDAQVSKALRQRRHIAIEFLKEFLDEALLSENPVALRADFTQSYEVLAQWLNEDDGVPGGQDIVKKLQLPTSQQANGMPSPPESDKQDQLEYIFEEWVRVQRKDVPEHAQVAFVQQLHGQHIANDPDQATAFFRAGIELANAAFEREMTNPYGTVDQGTVQIDALARLAVMLAIHQSPGEADNQVAKTRYFEALLRVMVLIMNDRHNKQKEHFNGRLWGRFYSTTLWELNTAAQSLGTEVHHMMLAVFAKLLRVTQPKFHPAFAFPWLSLCTSPLLVTTLLKPTARDNGGWPIYAKVLETLFTSLGHVFTTFESSFPASQDYYRAVLRFMAAVHHDYPDFLAEYSLQLDAAIPTCFHQLQNLVNSAVPLSRVDHQPDPFAAGLKINRIDNIREPPFVAFDVEKYMVEAGIAESLAIALGSNNDVPAQALEQLDNAIETAPGRIDNLFVNALVVHIGSVATEASSVFSAAAAPARLLDHLLRENGPEVRYAIVSAMAHQARYVNAHTHYFSTALQHFFATSVQEVQEVILRVLVERLMQPRPHPWGVLLSLLELLKNQNREVFSKPWVALAPQVDNMLRSLAQSSDRQLNSPRRAHM